MTPIGKGGRNDNDIVDSPEMLSFHLIFSHLPVVKVVVVLKLQQVNYIAL